MQFSDLHFWLVFRGDIPVPTPGPRDVLIKVGAAGVNNTDLNTRLGWYSKSHGDCSDASWSENAIQLPRIQGADVCGKVVAVGRQVDVSLIEKRVLIEPCLHEAHGKPLDRPWYLGSECDGGFAEYTVVAARHAYKIESKLSNVELASFPCSYSTAENLLTLIADAQEQFKAKQHIGKLVIDISRDNIERIRFRMLR